MHYANGREAKVGDPVIGQAYNSDGIISGTLVSLTPGQDSCSAQVEWTHVARKDAHTPRMATTFGDARVVQPHSTRGSESHGQSGPLVELWICRDYTHAGNLLHADDAYEIVEDVYRAAGSHFPKRPKKSKVPAADHPAAADQA